MNRNPLSACQHDRRFDYIFKLPNISDPMVSDQELQRVLRDRPDRFRDLLPVIVEKMIHQKGNVLSSVPKCRDFESD